MVWTIYDFIKYYLQQITNYTFSLYYQQDTDKFQILYQPVDTYDILDSEYNFKQISGGKKKMITVQIDEVEYRDLKEQYQQKLNKNNKIYMMKIWIFYLAFFIVNVIITVYLLLQAYDTYDHHIINACHNTNPFKCLNLEIQPKFYDQIYAIIETATLIYIPFIINILIGYKLYLVNSAMSLMLFIYLCFGLYGNTFNPFKANIFDFQPINALVMITTVVFEIFFTAILFGLKYLFQYSKSAMLMTFTFITLVLYVYYVDTIYECRNQQKYGLTGEMDFGFPYCRIEERQFCTNKLMSDFFDFTKGQSCRIQDMEKEINNWYTNYERNQTQEIKYLGWPLFNHLSKYKHLDQNAISEAIVNYSREYESLEEAYENGREIVIDVENQKLHINVQRNETFVQKQKDLEEILDYQPMSQNMICIFIDTTSRESFIQQLPKSSKYLKKYSDYNSQEYKNQGYDKKVFEFFRYQSIDKFTYNNMWVLNYNNTYRQFMDSLNQRDKQFSRQKKKASLFTEFKKAGYITGYANNGNSIDFEIISSLHYGSYRQCDWFYENRAHHELFFNDPAYLDKNYYYGFDKGYNSIFRRCQYGHDNNYYLLEYGEQFFDAYKGERKVMYFDFQDAHEPTGQVLKNMDDNLFEYFQRMESKGHLDDTMVYIYGDHGNHYRLFNITQSSSTLQDLMLPAMFMMVPNRVLEKYAQKPENIQINQTNIELQRKKFDFENNYLQSTLEFNQQPLWSVWELRNSLLCTLRGVQDDKYCQKSIYNQLPVSRASSDIRMAVGKDYHVCKSWNQNNNNNNDIKIEQIQQQEIDLGSDKLLGVELQNGNS